MTQLRNSLAYKEFYRSRIDNTHSDTDKTLCLKLPLRALRNRG